ncbi:MAG: class I SAM-dependent methyltransferase, partial [Myxococcota bacterium]
MSSPFALPSTWDAVVGPYDQHLTPVFGEFAERALALARASAGDRLLDVAAGPGTLALRAALYADVATIDFSPEMVARLRVNAAARGLDVDAREGDGQALPWADGTFDATFSMFGLIFFPDPAKGLAEMARVTRPGGRVTVSSWRPMDPRLQAVVQVLAEKLGMP